MVTGENIAETVNGQQQKIIQAEKWITWLGLKVNIAKTEQIIFHRFDTSAAQIRVKNITVKSSPVLKFLGMLFDNQMQLDKQVKKQ